MMAVCWDMRLDSEGSLHGQKIKPWVPAQMLPECLAAGVGGINHDCGAQQTEVCQPGDRAIHQASGETEPAMFWIDGKMIDVSASPIMTTEDGADQTSIHNSNGTNSRIAFEKCRQHFRGFVQGQMRR